MLLAVSQNTYFYNFANIFLENADDTVNMDTACDWVMAKLVSTQHIVGVMAN